MKMLDCFCGMGGVSDGFAQEGFDVLGTDIEPAPEKLGYKHKFFQANFVNLKGSDFTEFDVIWGSPPCRDFSKMARVSKGSKRRDGTLWAWKDPANPERGLILVKAYLKFVKDAKPRFWIMENVPFLEMYLHIKPNQISNIERTMKRAFWGNYPTFLLPTIQGKRIKMDIGGKLRSWERAKIPITISRAFARAIKEETSIRPESRKDLGR
jgi:site-specific DNA-cytosine methylase